MINRARGNPSVKRKQNKQRKRTTKQMQNLLLKMTHRLRVALPPLLLKRKKRRKRNPVKRAKRKKKTKRIKRKQLNWSSSIQRKRRRRSLLRISQTRQAYEDGVFISKKNVPVPQVDQELVTNGREKSTLPKLGKNWKCQRAAPGNLLILKS